MKSGKLVVYGNVGQTFLYGAKGGVAYVLGNAGGRALINAVGNVRTLVNGTCLDYAGESFMAGADLGGGFLLVNGLRINVYGEVMGLEDRYPGNSFFSLASGGAGYVNDPYHTMTSGQLNGTVFAEFTQADWNFLEPFLRENEALFGISIERDILTVDRIRKWPSEVFRKVTARQPARREAKPIYEMGMVESM
jgi:glutamate synthase domain-containing protein 3